MKLIGNIEVSGIVKIVFYNTGEAWDRYDVDEEEPIWISSIDPDNYKSHQTMIKIIQRKVCDPINYRVWIHGGTMNIVPEDPDEIKNYR